MGSEEREEVLSALKGAVELLEERMSPALIPEVGSNIVYAVKGAKEPGDVAAVEGRIVRRAGVVHAVGPVAFGASDHVARIVLTAMKFDPDIRSAANIRYSPETIALLEELFFELCSFDRAHEPPGIRTMDWGVASCCKTGVPDVIFDRGAVGKEPMIRVLGENPLDVANCIIKLSNKIEPAR
jgi:predicted fused transcriptional regulator/phosphomethylpyrimidine kinase